MEGIVTLFLLCCVGCSGVIALLKALYNHDHPQNNKDFDYWS